MIGSGRRGKRRVFDGRRTRRRAEVSSYIERLGYNFSEFGVPTRGASKNVDYDSRPASSESYEHGVDLKKQETEAAEAEAERLKNEQQEKERQQMEVDKQKQREKEQMEIDKQIQRDKEKQAQEPQTSHQDTVYHFLELPPDYFTLQYPADKKPR